MKSRLIHIIRDLQNPTVLVVGDLMLDKYIWGSVERISPEAPIPIINVTQEEMRPGGAGAVVSFLATLGARVLCVGVIGKDREGEKLLELLSQKGAEVSGVIRDDTRPTTVKARLMGHLHTAGRGVQQLLRVDYEKNHPLSHEIEAKILDYLETSLPHANLVALSDMNKGVLTERLTSTICMMGKTNWKPVIVDPSMNAPLQRYYGATAVTPNRQEAEVMTGVKLFGLNSFKQVGQKLVTELGLEYAIITLDKEGIFLHRRDGWNELFPTNPKEVFDVTGAGDMVLSTLALVIANGNRWDEAVQLANVAAGLEVGKIGACPITREELITALSSEENTLTEKIKTLEELEGFLAGHRAKKERIVFTNGCFDILHTGHVEYLRFARRQGEVLMVGLNTDRSVRENKGNGRPIIPERDRARLLAALEDVDYVVLFDDATPDNLIKHVKPDILVKGEDWKEKGVVGREFVESYGGKVILAPLVEGISTSKIISRIVEQNQRADR
ncbi:MAG TPA: D-glycero-beta-D-manno-heptose 1-phosphate adenylyltransferase [Candidatus Hypogeohydataceae bacterium YC41]